MFIYKITITTINEVYIGLDTHNENKQRRWKDHIRMSKTDDKIRLHQEMQKAGIENCIYEVIERGFLNISDLALAEIRYIEFYNSYRKGLNSTKGGDGLGKHDLTKMSNDDVIEVKKVLSESLSNYNNNVKWKGTTPEQRSKMVAHSFTPEVNAKRRETLKRYYKENPEVLLKKSEEFKKSRNTNKEYRDQLARAALALASEKNRKKIEVEHEDGTIVICNSARECQKYTKQWMSTLRKKSAQGLFHNGFRIRYL